MGNVTVLTLLSPLLPKNSTVEFTSFVPTEDQKSEITLKYGHTGDRKPILSSIDTANIKLFSANPFFGSYYSD